MSIGRTIQQSSSILLLLYFAIAVRSTIIVTSPAINPLVDSEIQYSYANIGTVPYGKTLIFDLIENHQLNLCQISLIKQQNHFLTPTYLLVDTTFGTCSFTTEALNAQQLGAKGVVFVSDMVNYYDKVVQVDDGNGRKVHITVLFISTMTYRQLHDLNDIKIKVLFETHQSEVVNITCFLSASGRGNYILLREIMPYLSKIEDKINFRPVYMTTRCPNCDKRDCLLSQDYCTFQLDIYTDYVGQFILQQQLRQWSLWKQFGTQKYLKYMDLFDQLCTVNWEEANSCGSNILTELNMEIVRIEGVPSEVMDEWRIEQAAAGFWSTPELTINEELYAGSYQPDQIFNTICETFIDRPEACAGSASPQSSIKVGWIIFAIILASIITIIFTFFIYKKCVNKQLTPETFTKVNELVAKYATEVQQHTKKRKDRLKMRLNEEL